MYSSIDPSGTALEHSARGADVSDSRRSRLTTVVHTRGPAVVLSFRGEADSFTMPEWSERIRRAADSGAAIVVVDTNCLNFLSLRALQTLARIAEDYRCAGVHLCLVTPSRTILRIATVEPLLRRLPIHSTVVTAMSCARTGPSTLGAAAAPS